MFRKIHYDRDPRDTIFTELKREFKPYINKSFMGINSLIVRHPKTVFGFMVVSILLSSALAFTVFRQPPASKPGSKVLRLTGPASTGIDQLLATGEALREMMRLKQRIDSLSQKKQLTSFDSLTLEQALDRFQQLNIKFNQQK
jgi:hypothetical protein